jgi:hypothetical protein
LRYLLVSENLFNSEVGTTCNVVLQDLTGVSLDKRATSVPKKPIVMWLMWVFIGIISFTSVCSVIAFAIQNNQHEEPMSVSEKPSPQSNVSDSQGK